MDPIADHPISELDRRAWPYRVRRAATNTSQTGENA